MGPFVSFSLLFQRNLYSSNTTVPQLLEQKSFQFVLILVKIKVAIFVLIADLDTEQKHFALMWLCFETMRSEKRCGLLIKYLYCRRLKQQMNAHKNTWIAACKKSSSHTADVIYKIRRVIFLSFLLSTLLATGEYAS